MGKPVTLLEHLCEHVMSFGSYSFETELNEHAHTGFATIDGARTRIANFPARSVDAEELRQNLEKVLKKPMRTVIVGAVYEIAVTGSDGRFLVTIQAAPKLKPDEKPKFTAKQGAYLAFIHRFTKVRGVPPSEADLQKHFLVSAPSVHEMIKTLERNGLIERTPRVARSIRVLVESKYLPDLR